MGSYGLLEQADEDALHKSRLLNVEERPFKRITKRLLIPNSIVTTLLALPPTPPPDGSAADEAAAAFEAEKQQQLNDRRQWREDALLDFAAFESSIVRIQFLLTSNIKERERYAAEKLKIQATAQDVRDNTADLRVQLEEAQKTLALRKEYDELAEKITSNRLLRPREDQHANLDKLNAEILELERESQEYAQTWAERRQQFGRIIEEGMQLRRLIRDEKEEVERREGMEEREEPEDGEASFQRSSDIGTPAGGGTLEQQHQNQRDTAPATTSNISSQRAAAAAAATTALATSEEKSPSSRLRTMIEEEEERKLEGLSQIISQDTDMSEDGEVSGDSELANGAASEEGLVEDGGDGDGMDVS